MKVNKFLLAGVAVLGLGMTACNDDDVPPVGNPPREAHSLECTSLP